MSSDVAINNRLFETTPTGYTTQSFNEFAGCTPKMCRSKFMVKSNDQKQCSHELIERRLKSKSDNSCPLAVCDTNVRGYKDTVPTDGTTGDSHGNSSRRHISKNIDNKFDVVDSSVQHNRRDCLNLVDAAYLSHGRSSGTEQVIAFFNK